MNINKLYKYFVVCKNTIISGWEFKEDATDHKNDLEIISYLKYKVYTASHLKFKLKIDPYNYNNWIKFEGLNNES